MFHTYQASANVMIIYACRRILFGRVYSVSAAQHAPRYIMAARKLFCLNQPPTAEMVTVNEYGALSIPSSLPVGKVWQRPLCDNKKISGCCRRGDKDDPQFVKKDRESQQHCGELRG